MTRWLRHRVWNVGTQVCHLVGWILPGRIPWCVFLHPHQLISGEWFPTDDEWEALGWRTPE